MSTTTPNLGLFKYNTTTDANVAFNINTALNANWDKIDAAISNSGGARNVGEIVASTIPLTDAGLHLLDGSLIQGDGIYSDFVDYIADLYDSSAKTSNVTKVGSLTDNNGVLSGFSTSNYAKFPSNFQPGSNSWEMVLKVTTGTELTSTQYIVAISKGFTNETRYGTRISFQNSHFAITVSYNGTDWDIPAENATGTYTVQPNTDYYVKFQYTGNAYILSYSLDGETYIEDINKTSSTPMYNGNTACLIGIWNNGSYVDPWLGSIDLKESYININGQRWWTGVSPSWATDESAWQSSVTQYGVCGKFVYDSTLNTVRLPKVTGIIEGTTDVSDLGDLVEAGLPNITGSTYGDTYNINYGAPIFWSDDGGALYGFKESASGNVASYQGNASYKVKSVISIDASRSSSIYGNSSTVQPQTIKVLYYIVIATSTKTAIQVDIDNIVNEWNNRYRYDSNTQTLYIGIDS